MQTLTFYSKKDLADSLRTAEAHHAEIEANPGAVSVEAKIDWPESYADFLFNREGADLSKV